LLALSADQALLLRRLQALSILFNNWLGLICLPVRWKDNGVTLRTGRGQFTMKHVSILFWCASHLASHSSQRLLGMGHDPNKRCEHEGEYPLHGICTTKQEPLFEEAWEKRVSELMSMLILDAANLNARDKYGRTALHVAKVNRAQVITDMLLAHKAPVDAQESEVDMALTYVLKISNFEDITGNTLGLNRIPAVVENLLFSSADGSLRDGNGDNALHIAISRPNFTSETLTVVEMLLEVGADLELKDGQGKSALDIVQNRKIHVLLQDRWEDVSEKGILDMLSLLAKYVSSPESRANFRNRQRSRVPEPPNCIRR
jgi:hypothetical protein